MNETSVCLFVCGLINDKRLTCFAVSMSPKKQQKILQFNFLTSSRRSSQILGRSSVLLAKLNQDNSIQQEANR